MSSNSSGGWRASKPAFLLVDEFDVAIAGTGPAAFALGAACRAVGLTAAVVGPDRPWIAMYGAWLDELDAGHLAAIGHRSPVEVVVGGADGRQGERRTLPRDYGMFANDRLRAALSGPTVIDAVVTGGASSWRDGWVLHTSQGRLAGRVVVDATGAQPVLVSARRPDRAARPVPAQTAYGLVLPARPEAVGGHGSVLMDWRRPCGGAGDGIPTFLYVMDLGDGRWLVEETSLARRPAVGHDVLRRSLATRLGADLTDLAEHVEYVTIPMAPGAPPRGQPIVGFGAAAGYVHPATGYSVATSLRAAPHVARSIVSNIDSPPAVRSARCWDAVWPREQRRSRALHDYGLAALLRMSADELSTFFGVFFALPVEQWSAYLRVDVAPTAVAAAMRDVFTRLPWRLRARLLAGSPLPFVQLLR